MSQTGSVQVSELMVIERYSHVMHIVSNVRGRPSPGQDAYDVVRACFPAGTVSGPRVYLPIESRGDALCPYCGTLYRLKGRPSGGAH